MDQLTNFYKQKLLEDLHLDQLPEEQQDQAMQMISERFQKVIVHTMLSSMNQEQKQQFESALENPDNLEAKVSEISEAIPGLANEIENALASEYEILKLAMGKS